MLKGTNVVDQVYIDNEDYLLVEDFIGLNTTKPPESFFEPAEDQPCTDLTQTPPESDKVTWKSRKYSDTNKFRVIPTSKLLKQPTKQLGRTISPSSRFRSIPESFDARKQWKHCDTMKAIRSQGDCGSCWAFGAAETFGDRYCITTGESISFSPQHLMDCYKENDGCGGGAIDDAWYDLVKQGIVTDDCKPYSEKAHECANECNNSQHSNLKLYYAKNAYSIYYPFDYESTVRGMQEEILENGPIEVAFFVFTDFKPYAGGVYQRTAKGEYEGGHAVKIIGWGVEKSTKVPYWLVANSWGENWGEKGFFRIRRGTNECGIETQVAAGLVVANQ